MHPQDLMVRRPCATVVRWQFPSEYNENRSPTDSGVPECWMRSVESSDCVTTESCGYARRTSRFQYGFCAGSDAVWEADVDVVRRTPSHGTTNVRNLWWLEWNTFRVETQEAAVGSRLVEGDH